MLVSGSANKCKNVVASILSGNFNCIQKSGDICVLMNIMQFINTRDFDSNS